MRVLYFGPCRLHADCDVEEVPLVAGATVGDLLQACCARHPGMAAARGALLVAVNQEFAKPDAVLKGTEEIAVMPPVSGGSGSITLTPGPVSALVSVLRQRPEAWQSPQRPGILLL